MTRFIQSNIRGLQVNREKFDMVLSLVHPYVISPSGDISKEKQKHHFQRFFFVPEVQKPAEEVNTAVHGGSAILIKSSIIIPHR